MIGSSASCVPVICPAQLSVAVGAVKVETSHSAVISVSVAVFATGAVSSERITFWVLVDVFPFPSSYVQVTTVVPCAMIGSSASCVPVIWPAQLSVAVGAVKVATSHSAVMSVNVVTSATGAVTSSIITFCVWVIMLPFPSSYVQVTTVVPCAVMGSSTSCVPVICPAQLSVAVGAVNAETSHSAVMSVNVANSATGAVTSSIITFWVWVDVFP